MNKKNYKKLRRRPQRHVIAQDPSVRSRMFVIRLSSCWSRAHIAVVTVGVGSAFASSSQFWCASALLGRDSRVPWSRFSGRQKRVQNVARKWSKTCSKTGQKRASASRVLAAHHTSILSSMWDWRSPQATATSEATWCRFPCAFLLARSKAKIWWKRGFAEIVPERRSFDEIFDPRTIKFRWNFLFRKQLFILFFVEHFMEFYGIPELRKSQIIE